MVACPAANAPTISNGTSSEASRFAAATQSGPVAVAYTPSVPCPDHIAVPPLASTAESWRKLISGSLSTTTNLVVNGVLVCGGTLSTSSNLTTTYSNVFANNPPPGFGQAPKLLPMSGTWLQSVN